MKVYQRQAGAFGKWIFAGMVFILAMTFTLSEVSGFNYPYTPKNDNGGYHQYQGGNDNHTYADGKHHRDNPDDRNNPPCAVPEPGTFMLLASGLGLALLSRTRKTSQI
jgi:hypothetical protein